MQNECIKGAFLHSGENPAHARGNAADNGGGAAGAGRANSRCRYSGREKAGARDLALVAGIATDKAELLAGNPTARVAHESAARTLEEAAGRLLEKLAARGIAISLEQAREKILEIKPEYRQLLPPPRPGG